MGLGHKTIITAAFSASCLSTVAFADETQLRDLSDRVFKVEGMAKARTFYGPPGYGEAPATDSRETVWILYLKEPLGMTVPALAGSRYSDELILQLILDGAMARSIENYADCLQFSGTLLLRLTGHHHTAVMLQAEGSSSCAK